MELHTSTCHMLVHTLTAHACQKSESHHEFKKSFMAILLTKEVDLWFKLVFKKANWF